jgi:hypothetical protein
MYLNFSFFFGGEKSIESFDDSFKNDFIEVFINVFLFSFFHKDFEIDLIFFIPGKDFIKLKKNKKFVNKKNTFFNLSKDC